MKLLKEPFVQFLIIGAVVFSASYLFTESPEEEETQIVIGKQVVQTMRSRLQKRYKNKLSEEEIEAKFDEELEDRIRQEILYREGLDRALDKEDSVVKYRVASKMERFAKEMASGEPFSDERIESYYNENKNIYTRPKRISFRHIMFDSTKRGAEQALADCNEVLARIQAGELKEYSAVAELGDQNPAVDGEFLSKTQDEIGTVFGKEFAAVLDTGSQAGLIAPVASMHGYHIVEIRKIVLEQIKSFEDVRSRIETVLEFERNTKAFNDFYDGIKGNYTIVVEDVR